MISTAETPAVSLQIQSIRSSPYNPRIFKKDQSDILELSKNIQAMGLISPIVVRQVGEVEDKNGTLYELIAGERRWRACVLAGLTAIPAIITALTDKEAIAVTVTENLQRQNLSAIEEATGVSSLIEAGWSANDIAKELGKTEGWVHRRNRIAKLSKGFLKEVGDNILAWSAEWLAAVAVLEPGAQELFLKENPHVIENSRNISDFRSRIAKYHRFLSSAPWKLDNAILDPKAGACDTCLKRSSCSPGLFENIDDYDQDGKPLKKKAVAGDRCLDAVCWLNKLRLHLAGSIAALRLKYPNLIELYTASYPDKQPEGTIPPHQVYEKKPKDRKTREAHVIFLNGENAGQHLNAFVDDDTPDKPTKKPKAKASKNPTKAQLSTLLADKLTALTSRREALVTKSILKDLPEKYPHAIMTPLQADNIVALAIASGCFPAGFGGIFDKNNVLEASTEDLARFAWVAARRSIQRMLTQYTAAQAHKEFDKTVFISKLLNIKVIEMLENAAKEIPEPKSIATLRASLLPKK